MTETDKQLEAEAREFRAVYCSDPAMGGWEETTRRSWLRVAAKHRELAAARYKPMVGAARVYMETHGQAEREALGRELDNLKGGA